MYSDHTTRRPDPPDAEELRAVAQSRFTKDPEEKSLRPPLRKASLGLGSFFQKSSSKLSTGDWDDTSRGAYSTVSKMHKAKLKKIPSTRKNLTRQISTRQTLTRQASKSTIEDSYMNKLDGFLDAQKQRSERRLVDSDEQSRGAYSTMSKMLKDNSRRQLAPPTPPSSGSSVSSRHLTSGSQSSRKSKRHLTAPPTVSSSRHLKTPHSRSSSSRHMKTPGSSESNKTPQSGGSSHVRTPHSGSSYSSKSRCSPSSGDSSRRRDLPPSAPLSITKRENSRDSSRQSRSSGSTIPRSGGWRASKKNLQLSPSTRDKAKDSPGSRKKRNQNSPSRKSSRSRSSSRDATADDSSSTCSDPPLLNNDADFDELERHTEHGGTSGGKDRPDLRKASNRSSSRRTKLSSSKSKSSNSGRDGRSSRGGSFREGSATCTNDSKSRRSRQMKSSNGGSSRNNRGDDIHAPSVSRQRTSRALSSETEEKHLSRPRREKLKTRHLRRLVEPERRIGRNSSGMSSVFSGSRSSTVNTGGGTVSSDDVSIQSLRGMRKPKRTDSSSNWRPPSTRKSVKSERSVDGSEPEDDVGISGDPASSSPIGRDFAPKSPQRHSSGQQKQDKTLRKPNRKSSSEFDFRVEDIAEEDEAADESSANREEETVDMGATEVDVFSSYCWSTAKLDDSHIHKERQRLRDSIRDTPFYRAYSRSLIFQQN